MMQESLIISPRRLVRRCMSPTSIDRTLFESDFAHTTLPDIVNIANHRKGKSDDAKLKKMEDEIKIQINKQALCTQLNIEVRERCQKLIKSNNAQNRYLLEARGRLKRKLLTVSKSKENNKLILGSLRCYQNDEMYANRKLCVQRAIAREMVLRNLNITIKDQSLIHRVFELGTTLQNWRKRTEINA